MTLSLRLLGLLALLGPSAFTASAGRIVIPYPTLQGHPIKIGRINDAHFTYYPSVHKACRLAGQQCDELHACFQNYFLSCSYANFCPAPGLTDRRPR